jgi:hypothetical protein
VVSVVDILLLTAAMFGPLAVFPVVAIIADRAERREVEP